MLAKVDERRKDMLYRRYVTECLAALTGTKRLWWDIVNEGTIGLSVNQMVDDVLNQCGVSVSEEVN